MVTFCLRLACGLIASLLVLKADIVPPRFFRVQYLTALGLLAVAAFFASDVGDTKFWLLLAASMLAALGGSIIWHVDGHPGHRVVLALALVALLGALLAGGAAVRAEKDAPWRTADDFVSAALLGAATSAMLMGHSYLIAPAMSLSPLNRLLGFLGVALGARALMACLGLYWWTGYAQGTSLEADTLLWLAVRWLVGLIGPAILGWLAWETARIRSTQSATGILYVVVIMTYLGELTSLLLLEKTGFIL